MGLFDSYKPKISSEELDKICSLLRANGFMENHTNTIRMLFSGDLKESLSDERGIDANELERGIKWLRENIGKHHFSLRQIDILEKEMKEKL